MQVVVGYVLILAGLVLVVLAGLSWFGVLKPKAITLDRATGWDVLLALVEKLPWLAIVGLALIYAGLKMIGVTLPF